MNKKVMALAVAGAFAAPGVAMAQASNVQIFGTMYMEYSYGHQGQKATNAGDLINADIFQTPGSEIGFKGEEALGGGLSVWFQCASTAEIRGAGTQTAGVTAGTQNSGIFCGRNSALGLKGGYGNIYFGNWDAPMKMNSGAVRIVSETGAWGTQPMLLGGSSSYLDGATPISFSRRENNSVNYITPLWNGFQLMAQYSTLEAQIGLTTNQVPGKTRTTGLGGNYTNGPLILTGNYERHTNFNPFGTGFNGTDTGWYVGAAYQFGPVKGGVMYSKRNFDGGALAPGAGAVVGYDGAVNTWNVALDWKIQGPHELLVSYTKANSTTGGFGANNTTGTAIGVNTTFNQGAGNTGGSMWEVEYQYFFSKRTRGSLGFVQLSNDNFARYNLGGFTAPNPGQNQNAFITSLKTTF